MSVQNIVVIGAGTVGVCCALYLQRDGHRVTLIDRNDPGQGCSYGNAGIFQYGACVPQSTTGILRRIPEMLLNRKAPLVIRWQNLPRMLPYLFRFVQSAHPDRVEQSSLALACLLEQADAAYVPLINQANANHLIRRTGEMTVYRDRAAYMGGDYGRRLRRKRGVKVVDMEGTGLTEMIPGLSKEFRFGTYLPDCASTTDPYRLTLMLAETFAGNGGIVLRENVIDLVVGLGGVTTAVTEASRHEVDSLVLATGAFSKPWASALGAQVPLYTERGYHIMISEAGMDLPFPILSGDYRFGLTPMIGGLRLSGTVELAGLDRPPDYERAKILVSLAKLLFPDLAGTTGKCWMGHRPSMPDSLPVLGRSPKYNNAYFAFGHGHLGLTLGGVTGKLIGNLVAGRISNAALTAFRANRF